MYPVPPMAAIFTQEEEGKIIHFIIFKEVSMIFHIGLAMMYDM